MRTSIKFYRDGLGFQTDAKDEDGWAIFCTTGVRFSLFPRHRLAEDAGLKHVGGGFGGITLAHNVRSRDLVDQVINEAVSAGGELLKQPSEAFWGGYSGYFADPDGYPWEVAWGDVWSFDEHGTLWGGPLGPSPGAQPGNPGGRADARR